MYKKLNILGNSLILLMILISTAAISESIVIGNPTKISIKADAQLNTSRCNLRIVTNGDGINHEVVDKIVQGPEYETSIYLTAQTSKPIIIEWSNGPGVWDGWSLISGCKGQGSKEIFAGLDKDDAKLQWNRYFTTYETLHSECVKGGLEFYNIKFQSNDRNQAVEGPQVLFGSPILAKCLEFTEKEKSWGKNNQNSFSCLVDNKSSVCEGFFAQRFNDGKIKPITIQEAVRLHFNQMAWTTGIRETELGRLTRIKNEEEQNTQLAAAEKKLQLAESPEYKKIQAEKSKIRELNEAVKQNCGRLIRDRWERIGTDKYGRRVQDKFIGWVPNGPFGPGKYGANKFWVFNLVLEKGIDRIDFGVDCVFDSSGKVLGLEIRRD
jgi:hypothetical protein